METFKDIEELLYNYNMLNISIQNLEKEIEFLKGEDGISATSYDATNTSGTNKINSIVEDTVLSSYEKVLSLERTIDYIKLKLSNLDRSLQGLSNTERNIIELKYFKQKQWYVIAAEVQYSERHCKRIRCSALKKLSIGMGNMSL